VFSKEEVRDGRPIRRDQPDEKGTITMRLTVNMNVSVDGVMQGLGGPEEDRRGGFERGGWAMPHSDSETMALIGEVYQRADAFLFGRWTYEVFAGSWGTGSWGANQGDNPISVALNTRPKYVASTTLTEPQWADTTVLSGDVAAAGGAVKAKPGGALLVVGSLSLVRLLLDHDLVDELTLLTYPVVVGQGKRLFPDSGPDLALELVESRATASGVTMQVYRTAGRPKYG
jgi:dihydrofolate reductase